MGAVIASPHLLPVTLTKISISIIQCQIMCLEALIALKVGDSSLYHMHGGLAAA